LWVRAEVREQPLRLVRREERHVHRSVAGHEVLALTNERMKHLVAWMK
jgi:hypothetical protein